MHFLPDAVIWTDPMTKLLIATRLEMNGDFSKAIPKLKLLGKIAQIVQENSHVVTGTDCDVKWRNLMSTYKKNKDKVKESGEGAIT